MSHARPRVGPRARTSTRPDQPTYHGSRGALHAPRTSGGCMGCWGAYGCGVGRAWFCGPHTSQVCRHPGVIVDSSTPEFGKSAHRRPPSVAWTSTYLPTSPHASPNLPRVDLNCPRVGARWHPPAPGLSSSSSSSYLPTCTCGDAHAKNWLVRLRSPGWRALAAHWRASSEGPPTTHG